MAQITLNNGAAASTPGAGNVAIYSKTDKKLYLKDDTGTESGITSVLSGYYQSAQQTITAAGALTLTHGLTAKPTLITATLVNVTADAGYTTGQELPTFPFVNITAGGSFGLSVVPDATNLTIRFASTAPVFYVAHATTGVATNIVSANWRIVFRAWV